MDGIRMAKIIANIDPCNLATTCKYFRLALVCQGMYRLARVRQRFGATLR